MNLLGLAQLARRDVRTVRASSWDTSGRNQDWWTLAPGESRVLADFTGPGIITHIWMTQRSGYRDCLLRITWDDAPAPSVVCPLGDFFCLGHNIVNSFQSLLFTASAHPHRSNRLGGIEAAHGDPTRRIENKGCALNAYVPMPFRRRCVIELVNESDAPHTQFFYIDAELHSEGLDESLGYFHAEFRRTNPFRGWGPEILVNQPEADAVNLGRDAWDQNYVILEARGRGHYLGCNLSVANFQGTWWGEGDDMIWVDGYKWPPDLHGTGSEDYFGQGLVNATQRLPAQWHVIVRVPDWRIPDELRLPPREPRALPARDPRHDRARSRQSSRERDEQRRVLVPGSTERRDRAAARPATAGGAPQ